MSHFMTLDPSRPIQVHAGAVSLTLVEGTVRWIRVAGDETVRGIYGAVRDPSWATIQPLFRLYEGAIEQDAFSLRFRAECVREAGSIDVAWEGTIEGGPDGTVRFVFDALCRSAFLTPRIGLCVLHPPRLAGQPVEVGTLFGRLEARFPDLITQYMPFSNIVSMRHDEGAAYETIVEFEGDLFETEDQRAFTDASYKTFSRPLEMPRPYKVEAGDVVRQVVTVRHPRAAGATGGAAKAGVDGTSVLRLGRPLGRTMPPIGSCAPPRDVSLEPAVRAAIAEVGLAHLRVSLDVSAADTTEQIEGAAKAAAAAGSGLEVLLVGAADAPGLDDLIRRVAAAGVPVVRLMAVDPASNTTSAALARRVRGAMASMGLETPLVGGSRAYLYQLVSRGVPADDVDLVSFPTNPQVHAFDEASMAETLEALGAGVRTAAALAGGKPVCVGPVSLRPLFNPDLVGPEPPPPPGQLPWRYDSRQLGAFAAAWTLGSVAAFAGAGVAALTLHEAAGWGGLVAAAQAGLPTMAAAPGTILPVGRVVQAIARASGAPLLDVDVAHPAHAVAMQESSGRVRLLVANLAPEPRRVEVSAGGASFVQAELLVLDEAGGASWSAMEGSGGTLVLPASGVANLLFAVS